MTAPPPQPQPEPPISPPQAALIAALAIFLAIALAAGAVTAIVAVPAWLLTRVVAAGGISAPGFRTALQLALTQPLPQATRTPAARATARREPRYRAAYLLAAARRITARLTHGTGSPTTRLSEAVHVETGYFRQHINAQDHRAEAAAAVDAQAARSGTRLRWHTLLDNRTTPDCAALHGTLFTITNPPGGQYPGQRHSHCRCTAKPA